MRIHRTLIELTQNKEISNHDGCKIEKIIVLLIPKPVQQSVDLIKIAQKINVMSNIEDT